MLPWQTEFPSNQLKNLLQPFSLSYMKFDHNWLTDIEGIPL